MNASQPNSTPAWKASPWLKPSRSQAQSPALALGTMNFGTRTPEAEAETIIHQAWDHGIRLFDTANFYSDGLSEKIVGKVLRDRRDQCLLATKVGLKKRSGQAEGLSRSVILQAFAESQASLQTDTIDVYYLHAPDHQTPIEETLDTLAELLQTGKIRAWGVSNYAAWQILELNQLSQERGMDPPQVSQVLYNLLIPQLDIEYFSFAKRFPIHTTVYNPLAGGLLTGRLRREQALEQSWRFANMPMYQGRYLNERMFDLVAMYEELAEQAEMSMVDFSYAWVAQNPGVDSILIGPGTVAHFEAALAGCSKKIPQEIRDEVKKVYQAFVGTNTNYVR
jgi:aryl-alcohol dehydrogenase-like predicted oxidoreductase